jgi:hypothetical protein
MRCGHLDGERSLDLIFRRGASIMASAAFLERSKTTPHGDWNSDGRPGFIEDGQRLTPLRPMGEAVSLVLYPSSRERAICTPHRLPASPAPPARAGGGRWKGVKWHTSLGAPIARCFVDARPLRCASSMGRAGARTLRICARRSKKFNLSVPSPQEAAANS